MKVLDTIPKAIHKSLTDCADEWAVALDDASDTPFEQVFTDAFDEKLEELDDEQCFLSFHSWISFSEGHLCAGTNIRCS